MKQDEQHILHDVTWTEGIHGRENYLILGTFCIVEYNNNNKTIMT